MKKWMTGSLLLAVVLGMSGVRAAWAKDTFDEEAPDAGAPEGYGVFGEELSDRGVTETTGFSGAQSACITVDFTGDKWGVIMLHNKGQWNALGGTISAQVCAPLNLTSKKPMVAFKLVDADGTGVRTPDAQLFLPGPEWTLLSQPVAQLTLVEEQGSVPGLDVEHIAQYGLVFYDQGDIDVVINFFVDDVELTAGTP